MAIPEAEIETMQGYAARQGAGYLSLESSAALAALPLMRERSLVDARDRIVVFDTGSGFKSEAQRFDAPPAVPNDPDAWPRAIAGIR